MLSFYKRKEWLEYRARCLKYAGYACERCKRTNTILQVHHPDYIQGRDPWEYPIEFSEVLCRRCHAEIHGKIKPSGGWTILFSDLENNEPSDPIPCENCGLEIRWHFTLYHPEWGEIIVGSECTENLSHGPEMKKTEIISTTSSHIYYISTVESNKERFCDNIQRLFNLSFC